MRIQHNIPALNSYRNYYNNVNKVSKNLEKLSTGYKINRAGDDAAGLAISEKMRIQITGLEKAQDNAKAGINLVQTAKGALTEVHDMLNRMFSLAEQSANGTFDDSVDRNQLQKEVNQLRDEIDRIADSTNYNGIKLLDGSMARKTVSSAVQDVGASAGDSTDAGEILSFSRIQDGDMGQDPQAGVFYIDLSKVEIKRTGEDAADLEISLFGKDLTITNLGPDESIGGEKLVSKIVEAWNAQPADEAGVEYNDGDLSMTMRASVSLDKKSVVLTMNNPPAAKWDAASNITLVEADSDDFSINGAESVQVRTDVEPVSTDRPRTYAQAKFSLADDTNGSCIIDGRTLQIGNETYVFAVGRNSSYANMENVVDLTDFNEADFNGDEVDPGNLEIAAMRLTKAAEGNSMFKVSSQTAESEDDLNPGVIYLTERDGAVDYAVNNLYGTANYDVDGEPTDADGDWTGLVKLGIVDAAKSTNGLTLQIGDTSENFNQLTVSVKDIHVAALNLDKIDISEQGNAQTAMDLIKAATNYVSDVRGGLGALQNRLDHTINNLSVAQENIQDAESVIRDVDVAKEMMAYTKNNILVQSAQAMLAQANQLPQGVLQLLG